MLTTLPTASIMTGSLVRLWTASPIAVHQCPYYVSKCGNISFELLSMEGQKALGFHQKYLILCSEDKQRSYGFGTTLGGVINDRIFILCWTNPLTSVGGEDDDCRCVHLRHLLASLPRLLPAAPVPSSLLWGMVHPAGVLRNYVACHELHHVQSHHILSSQWQVRVAKHFRFRGKLVMQYSVQVSSWIPAGILLVSLCPSRLIWRSGAQVNSLSSDTGQHLPRQPNGDHSIHSDAGNRGRPSGEYKPIVHRSHI